MSEEPKAERQAIQVIQEITLEVQGNIIKLSRGEATLLFELLKKALNISDRPVFVPSFQTGPIKYLDYIFTATPQKEIEEWIRPTAICQSNPDFIPYTGE